MNEIIKTDIINRIGIKRFEHSVRVSEEAIKLAKHYKIDYEKARIAGLYHDCAKIRDLDLLLKTAGEYELIISHDMHYSPQIIHAFLGAEIALKKYNIDDQEILDAMRYHTTGRKNMSMLEKIIYLADVIEPMRNFDGVEELRSIVYANIDDAMVKNLTDTIMLLAQKNNHIATLTFEARNYLLEMKNGKIF